MVVTQAQAGGARGGEGAEAFSHALTDWLERLEARGLLHSVNAHTLRREVIDRGKDGDGALLLGAGGGRISAPHLVGCFGDDRAVVRVGVAWLRLARRGQELVFTEQPQHPVFRRAHAVVPQARPDFAIPFSSEHGRGQKLPNGSHQLGIR